MASPLKPYWGQALSRSPNLARADRPVLVGLEAIDANQPPSNGSILFFEGDEIQGVGRGHVTSTCFSAELGKSIGLGLLQDGVARMGSTVVAAAPVWGRQYRLKVVPPNFLDPQGHRYLDPMPSTPRREAPHEHESTPVTPVSTPVLNNASVGPFEAGMARSQPDRRGRVQVQMTAGTLARLIQISTWIGGWHALAERLAPVMPVPAETGRTAWHGDDWVARTGPEDMLLIAAPDSPLWRQVADVLSPDIGHNLDLSHARCRLRLQGRGVVPSLQKLFALDFRESAFRVGAVRQSGSHHLPALLHRAAADAFDLYLHTTYARDQVDSIFDAVREWGVELRVSSSG